MQENKLFILDAYALIFRSYYAFIKNPRYNSKGLNTSAIFGFTNTVEEIINKEHPTHIAVCFDAPAATFRKEIYPEYKANRDATPEDIKKSIPYIKDILSAYNISMYEQAGYEADDLAGTIAKMFSKQDFEVFLMTSDKDYLQLIDKNIKVYKPRARNKDVEIIGEEEFCEKFNLESPKQFIDILALAGDTADNIPGIRGVGEKTALKLLQQFGSIENIYDNIDKLKGKQKEKFITDKENAFLSKELVIIKTDIDLDIKADDLKIKDFNKNKLEQLFGELEFKTLSNKVVKKVAVQQDLWGDVLPAAETEQRKLFTIKDIKPDYTLVETEYETEQLVEELNNCTEFAFDTETTSVDSHKAKLVGMSFCIEKNKAYYVAVPSDKNAANQVLSNYKKVLENDKITKIGQNIKYDLIVMKYHGINIRGQLFDTMIAHHLLSPELKNNMDYMAETYLDYQTIHIDKLIGKKGSSQQNMANLAPEKIKDYAAEDADITLQLKHIFAEKMAKEKIEKIFFEVEMPLIYVLTDIEYNGVLIDQEFLKKYRLELIAKAKETEDKIYELSGSQFNISSPKQLGDILFKKLKISNKPKLTKTKQYSTGEAELLKYKDQPIIKYILDYRSQKKLISTYIDALPKLVNESTNHIHTSYNQAVTITGRLSSNNPNLQNIPIRTAEGREIRKAFLPSADCVLIDADYSQVELRLMAHLSQDENMVSAFCNNLDIHTQTAANLFKVELEDVSKEMRYQAKTANFAMIYGSSAYGLAQNLDISPKEAKVLIDNYFDTYPKVKEYMNKMIKQAREEMFVTTLMGRKRYLHDINSRNSLVRSNAEHNAINTPIQGSAADIIKIAMINILNKTQKLKLKSKMIMQVHDELTFDVPIAEKDEMLNLIKTEMENAVSLTVPLIVDIATGNNWAEAH